MARKSPLPYENATSGERALSEVYALLARFGCQSFGIMHDVENGQLILQFKWKDRPISMNASWRGYAAAWLRAHPYNYRMRCTKEQHTQNAIEQGKIAVCSILRDWTKAQITMIETGLLTFEAVFLSHMLLPNGQRVYEYAQTELLRLPAPENGHVPETALATAEGR